MTHGKGKNLGPEAFLAALAMLGAGCSKGAPQQMSAEPPAANAPSPQQAPATATAAPNAASGPAPTPKEEAKVDPGALPSAQPAPPPRPRQTKPGGAVGAPPTASAACGAGSCSPEMKKGNN